MTDKQRQETYAQMFVRLSRSNFRSRFHLKAQDKTPMRGHPVFIAQHATACCCRGCLAKWHGIPQGVPLSAEQQVYIVGMLMSWMRREMEN